MHANNNKDTYQRITDYVINQLEHSEIVWQKGWNALGLPKNIATDRHYQGWNVFFLNFITSYRKYKTPYFITYKQALDKGGTIRREKKVCRLFGGLPSKTKGSLQKMMMKPKI